MSNYIENLRKFKIIEYLARCKMMKNLAKFRNIKFAAENIDILKGFDILAYND